MRAARPGMNDLRLRRFGVDPHVAGNRIWVSENNQETVMARIPAVLGAVVAVVMPMTIAQSFAADTSVAVKPTMHLEKALPQITRATGSFAAINGTKRSFTVDLNTTWDGRTLTMVEDFAFDDGERDRKTWRFTKTGENTYQGTREDVIGETTLTVKGRRATFSYNVYLDPANKANKVRFADTLVLQDDGSVLNTAIVWKYGLPVAKVVVNFEKPSR
jgi:hypothetical protein